MAVLVIVAMFIFVAVAVMVLADVRVGIDVAVLMPERLFPVMVLGVVALNMVSVRYMSALLTAM